MGGFNSPSTVGHNQGFRPHHAFGRENFGRFQHGGASMGFQGGGFIGHRAYQPNVSGMHPQPNFVNGQVPTSPYPHYGGGFQGGYHHASEFGGFQGGGNFIGHQGGFFGGAAGGHRHR